MEYACGSIKRGRIKFRPQLRRYQKFILPVMGYSKRILALGAQFAAESPIRIINTAPSQTDEESRSFSGGFPGGFPGGFSGVFPTALDRSIRKDLA
jgi:hypothetical protein